MRPSLLGGKAVETDRFGSPKKESDKKESRGREDRRSVRTKDWWAE